MLDRHPRDAASLLSQIVEVLRERIEPRYLMMETYGPDGEILEAWECWPLTAESLASNPVLSIEVLMPDAEGRHAEPRTDWQERGVTPPRGFHRSMWRN